MKVKFLVLLLVLSQSIFSQWELANNPKGYFTQSAYDAVDSLIIFTLFKDQAFLRVSKNYGKDWQEFSQPEMTCLSVNSNHKIWGCNGKGEIYFSENYGSSWVKQYEDEKDTFLDYIKFFDDNNGVCVGDSPDSSSAILVLKTSDGGATWESVNNSMGIGDVSYSTYYPICFPNKDVGYFDIAKSDQLNKTTDGGATWSETNFPDESVRFLEFLDENIGYAFSSDFNKKGFIQIYKTEDGGQNWVLSNSMESDWPMSLQILPDNQDQIYYTDFSDLYYSRDEGKSVKKIMLDTNSPNDVKFVKFVSDKIGYVITDSAHVYITFNNGGNGITGIGDPIETPDDFVLHPNYPNPFNPSTNLSIYIPEEGDVNLSIYDLLGNKVREIHNGKLAAGDYIFKFDGANLSSGIYLTKLIFNGKTKTNKMMLLK